MSRGAEAAVDGTSFNLARIVLREVSLALVEPFRISSGVTSQRRILLVEVIDRDGASGWGECVAGEQPTYSAETIDTAWLAIQRWIAPWVLGKSWSHPRQLWPSLQTALRGHRMAKAAVEMACWDLAARQAGTPLAALLGGERQEVETGISIGIQSSVGELVERAQAAVEAGYRKVKMKIEPGSDLEFVRAARTALGAEIALMVDANSAYTLEDRDHLAVLDEFDLLMIEQPLGRADLLRHARLQRHLSTPICLDESITSAERAADMIELAAGRIVNIKPGRVGGFTASLEIHRLCREASIPVWCGGMLESGVGRGHNVSLASLPGFSLPGDLSPSQRYWRRDIVEQEWMMNDRGFVVVRWDQPGCGGDIDPRRLAETTMRSETLR